MRSGMFWRHAPTGATGRRERRAAVAVVLFVLTAVAASGCAPASSAVEFSAGAADGVLEGGGTGRPLPRLLEAASATGPLASLQATRVASAAPTTTSPQPLEVRFSPDPGSVGVALDTPVEVRVTGGTLRSLQVSTPQGPAPGQLADGRFKPTSGLRFDTEYTLAATVLDERGVQSVVRSAFATMAAAEEIEAFVYPNDGDIVGIGMPVIVSFSDDIPVADRAAVTAKLSVHSEPAVQGAWRWISDSEVHWRPLQYWPARTQVWVAADLGGTKAAERWFTASVLQHFAVGEHHRITIDATTYRMTAFVDGVPVKTMPISAGKDAYPTASGIDLIMEKHSSFEMDSTSVGIYGSEAYNIVVDDAQRLTNSGTFIHAAPWNGSLGSANLSHGCINASNADARWMMEFTLIGDPVEITGTSEAVAPSNGWGDWNVSAQDWVAPQ